MSVLIPALFLACVALLIWAVAPRAAFSAVFVVRVRAGKAEATHGKVTEAFLAAVEEVATAFGLSPHVFYDEIRAERARARLREGHSEGEVARRIGFRRPAELRALLSKRGGDSNAAAQADADAPPPSAPAAE